MFLNRFLKSNVYQRKDNDCSKDKYLRGWLENFGPALTYHISQKKDENITFFHLQKEPLILHHLLVNEDRLASFVILVFCSLPFAFVSGSVAKFLSAYFLGSFNLCSVVSFTTFSMA